MSDSEWIDDPSPSDSDWVDDKEQGTAEKWARGALNALPVAGAMFGGAAGTIMGIPSGPGAIATGVAGAGLGMGLGESLKNIGEHYLGDEQTREEIYAGPAKAVVEGATWEMGGALLGQGLSKGVNHLAEQASPLLQKAGEGSRNLAKNFGARALGAERGTIKKLGADKVDELGAYALDEGLLSPLASTEDVIARNAAKGAEGGNLMSKVYNEIDSAGASTFSPKKVAREVEESIGDFWRSPINRGETNQLDNTLESIRMRGSIGQGPQQLPIGTNKLLDLESYGQSLAVRDAIPIKEAQALKQELGKVANWKNNVTITDKERMAREAYSIVSSQIDEAVETGAKQIGSEGLLTTLKRGKELYGNSKGAEELLENKFAREQGNKIFGITDNITGVGAAGALGPAGLGVLAAKKGAERFGAQNAAIGLNKISQFLMKSPQMSEVAKSNPTAFKSMVQMLGSKMGAAEGAPMSMPRAADAQPDSAQNFEESSGKEALLKKTQGSKYHQALQNAAKNGDESFSAAHYVLSSQDPNYKSMIEGVED